MRRGPLLINASSIKGGGALVVAQGILSSIVELAGTEILLAGTHASPIIHFGRSRGLSIREFRDLPGGVSKVTIDLALAGLARKSRAQRIVNLNAFVNPFYHSLQSCYAQNIYMITGEYKNLRMNRRREFFFRLREKYFDWGLRRDCKWVVQTPWVATALARKISTNSTVAVEWPYCDIETYSAPAGRSSLQPKLAACDIFDLNKVVWVIGEWAEHKNIERIGDLARELEHHGSRLTIVSTLDPRHPSAVEASRRAGPRASQHMRFIGRLGRDEIKAALEDALCLCHLSSIESFGLPIAEAMVLGCPVAVVNKDYAHALCSDSALYFNENDMKDAARVLMQYEREPEARSDFAQKGLARAHAILPSSWEKTARALLS